MIKKNQAYVGAELYMVYSKVNHNINYVRSKRKPILEIYWVKVIKHCECGKGVRVKVLTPRIYEDDMGVEEIDKTDLYIDVAYDSLFRYGKEAAKHANDLAELWRAFGVI